MQMAKHDETYECLEYPNHNYHKKQETCPSKKQASYHIQILLFILFMYLFYF